MGACRDRNLLAPVCLKSCFFFKPVVSNKHVKSPPLCVIFSIIMREKVSERSVLGSILVQTGLVQSSPVFAANILPLHSCRMLTPLTTREAQRVSFFFFPLMEVASECWIWGSGMADLSPVPVLSHCPPGSSPASMSLWRTSVTGLSYPVSSPSRSQAGTLCPPHPRPAKNPILSK